MADLIIVFQLPPNATAQQMAIALNRLGQLGFTNVAQGIPFPSNTVVGTWFEPTGLREIWLYVYGALREVGVAPTHLFIANFGECVWLGPQAR